MVMRVQTEVAIVGAGPVGLTAAVTLRSHGVGVVVLDAAEEGANTSRAAVVHARTLEVLEDSEITPRLLRAGVVVPEFTVRDRSRVLARLDFSGLPTRYPFTLMVPQSTTERILLDRLGELDGEVLRRHRVTSLESDGGRRLVRATRADGSDAAIAARFVIGADGTRSTVREAAGIAWRGAAYDESFVLADVDLEWPLPPREVQLFFSPKGLVVVAPLPEGRHRVVATAADAPPQSTAADIQTLLDQRGPGAAVVRRLHWSSRFRLQHRLADRYRNGAILLAGDAAHAHSPAGGQGMNIGIQDAADVGSTLAAVLAGAPEDILDGYEARRRPAARDVVRLTDRMTRAATLDSAVARAMRNTGIRLATAVPAVRDGLARRLAELPTR
jgi:2-polyprenyl-6-methoxyphenol hydroxylase-like FAD-dependent oxidoreductase